LSPASLFTLSLHDALPILTALDRIAVLSGRGKTGQAVVGAVRSRGHSAYEVGRSDTGDLAGVLAGCRAVYIMAPNMYRDEPAFRSEEHTSELQSRFDLVCR